MTKFLFAPTWLLFVYACLLDPGTWFYVNQVQNCEDIAFNLVAAAAGLEAPLMLDINVHDFGSRVAYQGERALSGRSSHFADRNRCLTDLAVLLGYQGHSPLRVASIAATRYVSTRVSYEPLANLDALRPSVSPRLVLEKDPAVVIDVLEDTFVDALLDDGNGVAARLSGALGTLHVRAINWWPEANEDDILRASLPRERAKTRAVDGTKLHSPGESLQFDSKYIYNDAIILLKIRHRDLYRATHRDERRPALPV